VAPVRNCTHNRGFARWRELWILMPFGAANWPQSAPKSAKILDRFFIINLDHFRKTFRCLLGSVWGRVLAPKTTSKIKQKTFGEK